ncbi:unnamed protein product, partial [Rotaria sp. Silwood2]
RYKFLPPFYQAERPVTNLAFAEGIKPHNDVILYATTESTVLSFRLIQTTSSSISTAAAVAASVSSSITSTLRDRRPFHLTQHHQPQQAQFNIAILETQIGCKPGCAVLAQSEFDGEQQFVIANSTGVFSYVGDDKRLGLGIDGEKLSVHWWFNYLITVTKENQKTSLVTSTTTDTTKPQSNILSQLTAHQTTTELQTLAVYDTNPQLTAYSVGIPRIQCVVNEWGYIHILTGDGELHRLIEKDLHSRLHLLFRKNCYQLALQLAKKNRTSKQGMAEIFKQFGDHLYV